MAQRVGGKLGQYLLVLLAAITLNYALPRLMPGSPLAHLAGEDVGTLTAADRARILRDAGLDLPLPQQFASYVSRLAHGDLGYSFHRKRPVAAMLADRLPWTLLLTGLALALSTVIGVACGAAAAWRRGRRSEMGALGIFLFLESAPAFWVAMMLVAVFGVQLGWLPTFGARDVFSKQQGLALASDVARHLVLPLATLVLATVATPFLTTRSAVVAALGEDYVVVARAKGLSERRVLGGHVLRNALLPVTTVFALGLGSAVAGATVVETVFSYPGVGRLMYEAAVARDYPLLQGGFLAISVCVLAGNVLADALYPLLDPRVRSHAR